MQFCRSVWDAACEILSLPLPLRAVLFGKYVRTERYVTRRVVGPLAQSPRSGLLALAWGHANGDHGIYRDRCVCVHTCAGSYTCICVCLWGGSSEEALPTLFVSYVIQTPGN